MRGNQQHSQRDSWSLRGAAHPSRHSSLTNGGWDERAPRSRIRRAGVFGSIGFACASAARSISAAVQERRARSAGCCAIASSGFASRTMKSASNAGAQRALGLQLQVLGGSAGRRDDALRRRHPGIHHRFELELLGHAEQMIFEPGVGAEDHLRAGAIQLRQALLEDARIAAARLRPLSDRAGRSTRAVDRAPARSTDSVSSCVIGSPGDSHGGSDA